MPTTSHSLYALFLKSAQKKKKIAQAELIIGIHLGKLELSAGL